MTGLTAGGPATVASQACRSGLITIQLGQLLAS